MQPRALHTRACIVQAAADLLIEQGGKCTTNHIAGRAGYSVGTLYQHFKNKEEIFAAVMDSVLQPPVQVLADFEPLPELKTTLINLIAAAAATLQGQDPALWRVLETLPGGAFPLKRQQNKELAITHLEKVLLVHRKEIQPQDLQLSSRMLIAAIEGIALAADRELFESQAFYEECFRLFYAYLKYTEDNKERVDEP